MDAPSGQTASRNEAEANSKFQIDRRGAVLGLESKTVKTFRRSRRLDTPLKRGVNERASARGSVDGIQLRAVGDSAVGVALEVVGGPELAVWAGGADGVLAFGFGVEE
jgi:hypothetical protein